MWTGLPIYIYIHIHTCAPRIYTHIYIYIHLYTHALHVYIYIYNIYILHTIYYIDDMIYPDLTFFCTAQVERSGCVALHLELRHAANVASGASWGDAAARNLGKQPLVVVFSMGLWQGLVNVPFWEYWTWHHLIVAIIDHIPNGWVMFNGDI